VYLPGAEQPERFNAVLLDFLATQVVGSGSVAQGFGRRRFLSSYGGYADHAESITRAGAACGYVVMAGSGSCHRHATNGPAELPYLIFEIASDI